MGFLSRILFKVTSTGITSTANGIGDAAIKLRSAITGDLPPDVRGRLEEAATELEGKIVDHAAEINKIEAKSASLFVAGWRPAIGWVCAISLAVYYWPRFAIGMYIWSVKCLAAKEFLAMPNMGIADVIGLVFSLLGIAGMRSWEKKQGVHNKH